MATSRFGTTCCRQCNAAPPRGVWAGLQHHYARHRDVHACVARTFRAVGCAVTALLLLLRQQYAALLRQLISTSTMLSPPTPGSGGEQWLQSLADTPTL